MNSIQSLIIGFDGADYELTRDLIKSGRLPNIERISSDGAFGRLESTPIPITPCAWSSLITGKNPGKHGIFDFTKPGPNGIDIVSSDDLKTETVFDVLKEHYTIGTLNIPGTYPPPKFNDGSFMVPGMLTPSLEQCQLNPEVRDILEENEYQIEIPTTYTGDNENQLLTLGYHSLNRRKQAAKELIRRRKVDVFMPVFTVADRFSHWFWKYHDESHPEYESSNYKDVVENIYEEIDLIIGELIEEAGGLQETNVFVVSDHGFTSLKHGLNMNQFLMDAGKLQIERSLSSTIRFLLHKFGFTFEKAYRMVMQLGLAKTVKSVSDNHANDWIRELLTWPFLSFEDVDWNRSVAYSAQTFGPIYVEDDCERNSIITLLEDLEIDGEPIIDTAYMSEEVFHGENSGDGPDIVYHTTNMDYLPHRYFEFASNDIITVPFNNESGHHNMDGIIAAAGPKINKKDGEIDASIVDVAPTVLEIMGLEPTEGMDGNSLKFLE